MSSNRLIRTLSFALFASTAVVVLTARADTLQEVNLLVKQGRPVPALKQLDKYLSSNPNDVRARFLKGVILAETNNLSEAIAIFSKLAEDHPELPEPYNNLAVIYARQQHYEKAKQALEAAIQTHPAYATAHKNLEDIYARLASQAYDRALQTESSRGSAPLKLATITDLSITDRAVVAALATRRPPVEVVSADTTNGESMSLDETPAAIKPAESPVPATTAKPLDIADAPQAAKVTETKQLPESIGRVGIESTHVAEAPVETKLNVAIPPKPDRIAAVSDVAKELTGWLAAWSEKNVDAYLAYYAKDFQTPGGESRAAWESERASRINKPGAIQVTYENLQITIDGIFATAKFRQHYKSNRLKTGTSKVVVLANRDGRWLIQQERIGK